jgi:rod shape-determining protein MreD
MRRPMAPAVLRVVLLTAAAVATVTLASRTSLPLPDLLLPVVVSAGLLSGASRGALVGLAGGWLVDVVPPGSALLGGSALLYAACGLLAGAGRREGEAPWGWFVAVGAAAVLVSSVGHGLLAALSQAPALSLQMGTRFVMTTMLCAVVVPLLVRLERRLARGRMS